MTTFNQRRNQQDIELTVSEALLLIAKLTTAVEKALRYDSDYTSISGQVINNDVSEHAMPGAATFRKTDHGYLQNHKAFYPWHIDWSGSF
jgi:hypothetical protein